MRKTFYYLLVILIPFRLFAQAPTIHNMENYTVGNSANFATVTTAPAAGASGAGQAWDFSALTLADTLKMQIVPPVSSSYHASYEQRYSDSLIEYIFNSSGISFIVATVDSASAGAGQVTTHPAAFMTGNNPVTFGAHFQNISTSLNTTGAATITGNGTQDFRADAYGSLKTPVGTFNNVMRIREIMIERDTIATFGIYSFDTTVSYIWYDDLHPEALMRIDSFRITRIHDPSVTTYNGQSAQYLLSSATEVPGIVRNHALDLAACFNNSTLVINGTLETGKQFEMSIINTAGQLLYKSRFLSQGNVNSFNINSLAAGMYFVSVKEIGQPNNGLIKLVKQ